MSIEKNLREKAFLVVCQWAFFPFNLTKSFFDVLSDLNPFVFSLFAFSSSCLQGLQYERFKWLHLKLSCDSRFQRAFTACSCVLKVITLVWANQRNHFENATACSKRMRKTLVATQLKILKIDQGWPEFFDRGPNLKIIFHLGQHYSK
jgi:hypothetical protein